MADGPSFSLVPCADDGIHFADLKAFAWYTTILCSGALCVGMGVGHTFGAWGRVWRWAWVWSGSLSVVANKRRTHCSFKNACNGVKKKKAEALPTMGYNVSWSRRGRRRLACGVFPFDDFGLRLAFARVFPLDDLGLWLASARRRTRRARCVCCAIGACSGGRRLLGVWNGPGFAGACLCLRVPVWRRLWRLVL